jgi:hypothetical protein
MRTRNLIVATIAGIAFVAGGFWAGSLGSTAGAEALETGDAAVAPTDVEGAPFGALDQDRLGAPGRHGHDGPRHDVVGEVVEDLDLDTEMFREAIADGATIAEAAAEQGVERDELVAAIVAAGEAAIDEAVEEGRIDPERAEQMRERLAERADVLVDRSPADRRFARNHPVGAAGLANAAEVIGIEAPDLADALRDGQTVAEVAADNGVGRDELVAGLLEVAEERIQTWIDRVPGEDAEG